jgi:hypothetical protein
MQIKAIALTLLSLGSLAVAAPAAAAPASGVLTPELAAAIKAGVVKEGPFPIDYKHSDQTPIESTEARKLAKRADCYNGPTFYTSDIQALGNYMQTQSGNDYLPATSSVSWTWGTAKLCVYNNYVFENTHVSYWEMGWGLLSVSNQCCLTNICSGGVQQGHGDSGLAVNIVGMSSGDSC